MNPFDVLVEVLGQFGLPGLAVGLAVLVGVFFLKRGGMVVNGNWARVANVILAAILSGLDPTNPDAESGVTAAIAVIVSSLVYEVIKWFNGRTFKLRFVSTGWGITRGPTGIG